jgi:WD40 repeat protein
MRGDALRSQASDHKGFPWLRPLSPSLTPLAASLVRTLQGHTSSVNAVAATPDGRHVVSGSFDNTLRVWNLKYKKEILTFTVDGRVTKDRALASQGIGKLDLQLIPEFKYSCAESAPLLRSRVFTQLLLWLLNSRQKRRRFVEPNLGSRTAKQGRGLTWSGPFFKLFRVCS